MRIKMPNFFIAAKAVFCRAPRGHFRLFRVGIEWPKRKPRHDLPLCQEVSVGASWQMFGRHRETHSWIVWLFFLRIHHKMIYGGRLAY